MNLGLEYLQRTGAVLGLFRTPAALYLEGGERAMVVTFAGIKDSPGSCVVTRWKLDEKGELPLPACENVTLDRSEIFTSPEVIRPGFSPIRFIDQPIPSGANSYNHPIEDSPYASLNWTALNPNKHRIHKADWLWDQFIKMHLRRLIFAERFELKGYDRRHHIERELHFVKTKAKASWEKWVYWCDLMLPKENVASEYLFLQPFNDARTRQAS